jgi:Tol biopolymer transport system component
MPTSPAPLLVNQRDGRVVTAIEKDGHWTATDVASSGRWPSWSPDREWTVRSDIAVSGESARSTIVAERLDGTTRAPIYEGAFAQATFIAPNVPHYALWSPNGSAVSYVAATEQGLSLAVSTVDGALREHRIATGVPLFHSWSADGSRIAVHEGARLSVFDLVSLTATEVHQNALGFRAPQFTADGSLLYASPAPSGGIALFKQDTRGRTHELGRFDGGLAFTVAGLEVFVAVTRQPDASTFDALWRVALDGAGREPVARGPLAAFWPSPAGDVVVTAVPVQSGDGSIALRARSASGEVLAATEAFLPSNDLRVAMAFFDQYGLSHSPWSPAGDRFVIAGRVGADAVSTSFGDPIGDCVMTWRPARAQPLERIVPGTFASFPSATATTGGPPQ